MKYFGPFYFPRPDFWFVARFEVFLIESWLINCRGPETITQSKLNCHDFCICDFHFSLLHGITRGEFNVKILRIKFN